jgi:molecular chaperone DnaJ
VRDLYDVLGVERDADDETIKRAYRRKARELHPDTGGDEEEFKELTTAYEVLKNPQARANYDRFGDPRGPAGMGGQAGGFGDFGDLSDLFETFFGGGGFGGGGFGGGRRGRTGPRQGRDALIDVRVTLAEAAEGIEREVDVEVLRACDTCGGDGAAPGTHAVTCETCQGSGQVQQVARSVFGQVLTQTTCPTCRGQGQRIAEPCPTCNGQGRHYQHDTISIPIPAGVDDGRRLRLSGRGEAGPNGGPAGDLFVRVRVEPHELFEREGNDLHCQVRLTMTQAVLGAELDLPTLDGETTLSIPSGTQPGDVIRIRRQGMPKLNGGGARGDLLVHCKVEIPGRLPEDQADLVRQLAELRGEDDGGPHAGRGLFERLRGVFGG